MGNVLNLQNGLVELPADGKGSNISVAFCHESHVSVAICTKK